MRVSMDRSEVSDLSFEWRVAEGLTPYPDAIAAMQSRVAAIQAPIFVMQGSADRLVPPAMGRKLIQAATAPTELWVADGAGHEDLGPYGAVEAAAAFVAKWCPLQPRHDQK